MILYLWDVRTLGGSACGVTDDEKQARLAASAWMLANDGVAGRVERAAPLAGGARLMDGYRRLGSGWSARLRNGRVTWVAFR